MYNERALIVETAQKLSAYMQSHFDSYEILFSDDGSSDGSGELVRALDLPNVRVLGYEQNAGKGCAVRTAMLQAEGEMVMFTDADLAYGTDVIRRMYDTWEEKKRPQLLLGSRNLDKDGYAEYTLLRRVMSKVYIKILSLVGHFRLSDSQCGCKAFENHAAKEIFSRCRVNGFAFDFEAILWADTLKYRIEETPVRIVYHRESKIHVFRDTYRMLRDLIRIRKSVRKQAKNLNVSQ